MDFFETNLQSKINDVLNEYHKICDMLCYEEVLADKNLTIRLAKQKKVLEPLIDAYQPFLSKDLNQIDIEKQKQKVISAFAKQNSLAQSVTIELACVGISPDCQMFCFDLLNAYKNFCEKNILLFDIAECQKIADNKIKSAIINISGLNALEYFLKEVGFHKAIFSNNHDEFVSMFAYKKIEKEIPSFTDKDIKIDIFRSNGAGGQNINKVSTAVRITHIKTNIVVTCQDERSQFQNRERAFDNLKQKVISLQDQKYNEQLKQIKASQKKDFNKNMPQRVYNYNSKFVLDSDTNINLPLNDFLQGNFINIFEIKKVKGE